MKPTISIIYVYYATPSEILQSMNSLKQALGNISYEVIIINNASPIVLPDVNQSDIPIKIITNNKNNGYGKALNQGAHIAKGTYLALVNPDTLFLKASLKYMTDALATDQTIGIIGPQFLDEQKNVTQTGNGLPILPDALFAFSFLHKYFPNNPFSNRYFLRNFDRKIETEIPVICGACMVIKKSNFDKIQGFDEQFFLYFEESDLCHKVKKTGLRVVYYPKAKVIHFGGRSSSNKKWIRKQFEISRYKFFKKYHNFVYAFLAELFLRIVNSL